MMNGREKSHSAIVAAKPTSKADATSVAYAAESVEPRAGTKRNAEEQSTHRNTGPGSRDTGARPRTASR
jgi:hypothetical protein